MRRFYLLAALAVDRTTINWNAERDLLEWIVANPAPDARLKSRW